MKRSRGTPSLRPPFAGNPLLLERGQVGRSLIPALLATARGTTHAMPSTLPKDKPYFNTGSVPGKFNKWPGGETLEWYLSDISLVEGTVWARLHGVGEAKLPSVSGARRSLFGRCYGAVRGRLRPRHPRIKAIMRGGAFGEPMNSERSN